MQWKDIVEQVLKGVINPEDEVIVYDMETGEEYTSDLIEFDDSGEVCIIINGED
jgi:hypothetical protein